MSELRKLYRDACDKTGGKESMARLFNECELLGIRRVYEISSGRRLSVKSGDSFEKTCEFTFDSGKAVQNIASIQIPLHNITGLA